MSESRERDGRPSRESYRDALRQIAEGFNRDSSVGAHCTVSRVADGAFVDISIFVSDAEAIASNTLLGRKSNV